MTAPNKTGNFSHFLLDHVGAKEYTAGIILPKVVENRMCKPAGDLLKSGIFCNCNLRFLWATSA